MIKKLKIIFKTLMIYSRMYFKNELKNLKVRILKILMMTMMTMMTMIIILIFGIENKML
jgi:hypothetical protein